MSETLARVNLRDLSTLGYTMGLTHWAHKAGDHTPAELLTPGYWDEAFVLHEGDWIFVSGRNWAMQLYVMQSDRRVVVSVVAAIGALGELPGYPETP